MDRERRLDYRLYTVCMIGVWLVAFLGLGGLG